MRKKTKRVHKKRMGKKERKIEMDKEGKAGREKMDVCERKEGKNGWPRGWEREKIVRDERQERDMDMQETKIK